MDILIDNWLFSAIALVLLDRFKVELSSILKIFFAFTKRIYKVGDRVQLWNEATGNWKHIVEITDFKFHISEEKRGCWVMWSDGEVSKIGLLKWFAWFKRPAPNPKKQNSDHNAAA